MDSYYETRYTPHPARQAVWKHLCAYFNRRWIPKSARVIDIGAGYCSFINQIQAAEKWACDAHPDLPRHAAHGVKILPGGVKSLISLPEGAFDVVFASNLFEHLTREELLSALAQIHRILGARGRLVVMQPNFKYCMADYFDDLTHVSIFTHVSFTDLLRSTGWAIAWCEKRFFPYSFKSGWSRLGILVPLYLRLPYKPLAAQMLVVAEKVPTVEEHHVE
jgi:SAM-dependent methyltransferase